MPRRDVVVHVTPGDARPAGWCPRCALPSLVTLDLCAMTDTGVTVAGTWTGCTEEDCDEGTGT